MIKSLLTLLLAFNFQFNDQNINQKNICAIPYNKAQSAAGLVFAGNITHKTLNAENSVMNKGSLIIGTNSIQKVVYLTSSNYGKNHDGMKAIDNDKNSEWISKSEGDHWLEIDFGAKRIMNKIVVYPGRKDNYKTIKFFHLQFLYKDEWFNFKTITLNKQVESGFLNFLDKSDEYDKAEIDLIGVDASKFRIFIPEDATYNGYAAISEVEIYIGSVRLKCFDERLSGMRIPIRNGLLPLEDSRYPNAPRTYRGGTHVGLDILFYHDDDTYEPVNVSRDTPVLAAKKGKIIRADWDYKPMTVNEWLNQSDYYQKNPSTFVQRSFGGVQVWIDHEDGVVTTYNHLSKIDGKIKNGARVEKGEQIGWAGNSGLLGEAENKDYGIHLHFEIWVDGYFLGRGMSINDIKKYFSWIFSER